jgi:hypothetical protein
MKAKISWLTSDGSKPSRSQFIRLLCYIAGHNFMNVLPVLSSRFLNVLK